MISCIACNAQIESDSFFCDQCGQEVKKCMQCGTQGKGKRCTQCGGLMSTAKELATSVNKNPEEKQQAQENVETTIRADEPLVKEEKADTATIPPEEMPKLKLINKALNLDLSMEHNDIIGRRQGRLANIFSAYNQISGKHAKIFYDNNMGWCITDLDSTNGVRIAGKKIEAGTVHPLRDNTNIIIANIEFFISIK